MTTRPAFCGTVPKLGALYRVPQDVSCVLHFNYVFCIFFPSQKLKYQNKKYIKNCDWHLKIHLRSRHVLAVKITNRRSGREGFPLELSRDITEKSPLWKLLPFQPFLKSYWLTPVQMTGQLSRSMQITCKY